MGGHLVYIIEGPCPYYDVTNVLSLIRPIEPCVESLGCGPPWWSVWVSTRLAYIAYNAGRLDFILTIWGPLKSLEQEHNHFKIVT